MADAARSYGKNRLAIGGSWAWGDLKTWDRVLETAASGWDEHLEATLRIAEDAVSTVEQDTQSWGFQTVYDVTGTDVDVDRYLTGVPECMIAYPLIEVPRVGRVITLCASISVSGSVSERTLVHRGQVLTALAIHLSRMGLSTELWADFTASPGHGRGDKGTIRTLVKGANDVLDPARILYAYAHPSMPRGLGFACWPDLTAQGVQGTISSNAPGPPSHEGMPEGTIYLPELLTSSGSPNAADELRALLRQCGITE